MEVRLSIKNPTCSNKVHIDINSLAILLHFTNYVFILSIILLPKLQHIFFLKSKLAVKVNKLHVNPKGSFRWLCNYNSGAWEETVLKWTHPNYTNPGYLSWLRILDASLTFHAFSCGPSLGSTFMQKLCVKLHDLSKSPRTHLTYFVSKNLPILHITKFQESF